MRSDNLVPLLAGSNAGKGVGFRQAVIVTYNQATAENSVLVGTSLLNNLPILNTSEAAILAPGDVVGILTFGGTWGILGRFTIPGTPQAVSALSALRSQSDTVLTNEPITSGSFGDPINAPGPTVTVTVGASRRVLVLVSAECSGQASKAGGNTMVAGGAVGFQLSGANILAPTYSNALQITGNMMVNDSASGHVFGVTGGMTRAILLNNLNPGPTTITAKYSRLGNGVLVNIMNRNITALAL